MVLVLPSLFDDEVTSVINSYRHATRGESGQGELWPNSVLHKVLI